MELRGYQIEAIQAVYRHWREKNSNPCIVLPTGSGKSFVLAQIASDIVKWGGRAIILAHVKELLQQNFEHLEKLDPTLFGKIGVYSAGLKARDTQQAVIIGGIHSVYDKADLFGPLQAIIVDEAHRIPPDSEGMYLSFIKRAKELNPEIRVIGLTATPFRTSTGAVCGPENVLNEIVCDIGVRELIVKEYLSKLRSKGGTGKLDTSGLAIRGGEFIADEVQLLMGQEKRVQMACMDIEAICNKENRQSILVFCSGVDHAKHVTKTLNDFGIQSAMVDGETPYEERDRLIRLFKEKKLRCLVNVNVLTEGFDAPGVDCVCLLRPTMSPGLYYQMVGRGFRLAPGKDFCLVLDFGQNVARHGPVDLIDYESSKKSKSKNGEPVTKQCPQCNEIIHARFNRCPACDYEFPPPERKHDTKAGDANILSEPIELEVEEVLYSDHLKKNAPQGHPHVLRVTYRIVGFANQSVDEWICLAHPEGSYPRSKAVKFWKERGKLPVPKNISEALNRALDGELLEPKRILIREESKYDRVLQVFDLTPPEKIDTGGDVPF